MGEQGRTNWLVIQNCLVSFDIEWIFSQHYSGSVSCFLLDYQCIYRVVQKRPQYFMPRLPPELACL
jgi:hypothetical protein